MSAGKPRLTAPLAVALGLALFGVLLALGMVLRAPDLPLAEPGPSAPAVPPLQPPETTALGFGAMNRASSDPSAVEAATALFNQSRQADPYDAGAAFGLGWASQTRGDNQTALRYYLEADNLCQLAGAATQVEYFTHFNLYWLYQGLGRPELAEIEQIYAEQLTGDPPAAGYDLNRSLEAREVYELARVALGVGMTAGTADPGSRFHAGIEAWRSARLEAAREAFTAVMAEAPRR